MQHPGYIQQPQVTVVLPNSNVYGETPMQVTCGNCQRTVITTTRATNGACAYLATVIMVIVFCPCFFIPLLSSSCKDVHHYCPSCGAQLGTYKRL